MDLTPELKNQIDTMSLYSLLYGWRFSKVGEPIFQGESGEYYSKVMTQKRDLDPDGWSTASRSMGW